MGTSKNDMMMILQLAKTFLAKKFKLKKGGDPFAKLGRAWQEPQCKAIAVFFGVRSALRVKIASALPEYRCAFAFGKTNPQRQLAFFKNNVPSIVVLTSPRIQLSPEIAEFLAEQRTRIIYSADTQQAVVALQQFYISVDKEIQVIDNAITVEQDCFPSSVIYINIPENIIDTIAEETKGQRNIFINIFSKHGFDNLTQELDKYSNISDIYTLDEQNILPDLRIFCKQKNITISVISEKILIQKIFQPVLNKVLELDKKTSFALIWNISKYDSSRVSPSLSDYTVLKLNPIVSHDTFCGALNILAKKYSFTFFDYESTMPDQIRILAEENAIPVYHLHESVLGKLYYRKPFKNPLFVTVSQDKPNNLGLPDRTTFMSWLDKKYTILDGDALLKRMRALHALLLKGRKAPDQTVTDLQKEHFVLAVWHEEEAQELSFETFITIISENIKQENIVCLALAKGKATDKRACLAGNLRFRTAFLRHAEDFDSLCPYATEVHVVGSFYGFEALLVGRPVVTHGQPFYAGFGWTKDLTLSAPICEQDFQYAALIALFGNNLTAPYTGETLSPDQALALHHLWLRSDFSYFFEQMAHKLGKDERYPNLDLRRKYYHTIDPSTTQYILENLSGSNFGLLLHSLFNFRYACYGLDKLFASLPNESLFKLLVAIVTYCRVNSLFDMLSDITKQYVEWFSKNTFSAQEVYSFYALYFFLQKSNRYRELAFPEFKELPEHGTATYQIYARIAIYSCHYEELYTFFDSLPEMPTSYYSSLLSYLMEYPYGSRERDIWTRIDLRQKIFSAFLEGVISNEKIAISENSILLIRYSLTEDLAQIQKYANAVLEEQDNGKRVTPAVASLFSFLLSAYIQRCYYTEAELFLRILSKSELERKTYFNQWKRLRKIADGFIPTGMTSAKRKQQIERNMQASYQACLKKTALQDVYDYSWRAAIEEFYLKSSEIIAKVPQPQNPRGYIFIPHFGLFQTAILPLVVCSLARRGYASIILGINHLFINNDNQNKFYKFAYSVVDRPLRLSCPWEVDLKNQKISVFGINFYERFVEFIRMHLRIFTIDFNNPIQRSYLQQFMYQADAHLKLCNEVYQFHKKTGVQCGLLSSYLLVLPQVIWLDFMNTKNDVHFRNIFCRTALTQKMEEGVFMEDVSICAMDMANHPEQRLPFLPTRKKFQAWYKDFRKDPTSGQILAELRSKLLCPAPADSPVYERLLREKAAGKKIIFCYSRLLYDLSLRTADGGSGHANMEDWLRHSIQIAAENKDIFLVIKPHPHEEEPEFAALPVEKLQDILPALPDNVLLLHPRELKTPQLLGLVDMVALWLGTAISELTALGVPVVVCSYAGITDTPFDVKTFKDREDYAHMLRTASCPAPTQEEQDMAAGMIKFSKEGHMVTPYPYSFFSASNDFRSIPYYDDAAVERYFTEGDPHIEHIVDQILEGFDTSALFLSSAQG